ncbi:hypothetical protein HK098_003854 [Nowakowskiella sp. JEL0407]|nr:hypothetical protein HK098_003854 [Nowakowskiella sp. JEL0407]
MWQTKPPQTQFQTQFSKLSSNVSSCLKSISSQNNDSSHSNGSTISRIQKNFGTVSPDIYVSVVSRSGEMWGKGYSLQGEEYGGDANFTFCGLKIVSRLPSVQPQQTPPPPPKKNELVTDTVVSTIKTVGDTIKNEIYTKLTVEETDNGLVLGVILGYAQKLIVSYGLESILHTPLENLLSNSETTTSPLSTFHTVILSTLASTTPSQRTALTLHNLLFPSTNLSITSFISTFLSHKLIPVGNLTTWPDFFNSLAHLFETTNIKTADCADQFDFVGPWTQFLGLGIICTFVTRNTEKSTIKKSPSQLSNLAFTTSQSLGLNIPAEKPVDRVRSLIEIMNTTATIKQENIKFTVTSALNGFQVSLEVSGGIQSWGWEFATRGRNSLDGVIENLRNQWKADDVMWKLEDVDVGGGLQCESFRNLRRWVGVSSERDSGCVCLFPYREYLISVFSKSSIPKNTEINILLSNIISDFCLTNLSNASIPYIPWTDKIAPPTLPQKPAKRDSIGPTLTNPFSDPFADPWANHTKTHDAWTKLDGSQDAWRENTRRQSIPKPRNSVNLTETITKITVTEPRSRSNSVQKNATNTGVTGTRSRSNSSAQQQVFSASGIKPATFYRNNVKAAHSVQLSEYAGEYKFANSTSCSLPVIQIPNLSIVYDVEGKMGCLSMQLTRNPKSNVKLTHLHHEVFYGGVKYSHAAVGESNLLLIFRVGIDGQVTQVSLLLEYLSNESESDSLGKKLNWKPCELTFTKVMASSSTSLRRSKSGNVSTSGKQESRILSVFGNLSASASAGTSQSSYEPPRESVVKTNPGSAKSAKSETPVSPPPPYENFSEERQESRTGESIVEELEDAENAMSEMDRLLDEMGIGEHNILENGCKPVLPANGTIIAFAGQWCSFETQARHAQDAGAVAVIWISDRMSWQIVPKLKTIEVTGPYAITRSGEYTDDIVIPFVEVSDWEFGSLLKILKTGNTSVIMDLFPNENEYLGWFQNWKWTVTFRIILPGWALANGVFASVVARQVVIASRRKGNNEWSLPLQIMIIEIVASLLRVGYLVADPIFSTGTLPYSAGQVLITLHQPAALGAGVAIGMYWYSVSRNIGPELMWKRYKRWLWLIIGFFVVVELTMSICKAFYFPIGIHGSNAAIANSVLTLAVEIWFVSQGRAVLNEMNRISKMKIQRISTDMDSRATHVEKEKQQENVKKEESLQAIFKRKIIRWIVLVIISMTSLILGWLSMTFPLFYTPSGFFASWFVIFFGFNALDTTQIIGFANIGKREQCDKATNFELEELDTENVNKSNNSSNGRTFTLNSTHRVGTPNTYTQSTLGRNSIPTTSPYLVNSATPLPPAIHSPLPPALTPQPVQTTPLQTPLPTHSSHLYLNYPNNRQQPQQQFHQQSLFDYDSPSALQQKNRHSYHFDSNSFPISNTINHPPLPTPSTRYQSPLPSSPLRNVSSSNNNASSSAQSYRENERGGGERGGYLAGTSHVSEFSIKTVDLFDEREFQQRYQNTPPKSQISKFAYSSSAPTGGFLSSIK